MGKRIKEAENRDRRGWLILLLLLMLIFAAIAIWALFFRQEAEPPTLTPDHVPEQTEPNAQPIPGDTGGNKGPSKGGSVSLTYSDQVTIDLSKEEASLIFANPGRSSRDAVLQIVVQDVTLVQSGALQPGNQVKTLSLLPEVSKLLSPGGYEGKFVVYYYDLDTGAREVVNTEIPIFVTVQK